MKNAILILCSAGMLSIASACTAASSSTVEPVQDAAASHPAQSAAQNESAPVHIVELFTSQGCSSCPPANKFVNEIANNDGVLALTYGVTYWDYLGWEDTFGDPKFTKRQRDYRRPLNARNAYTPQLVLNGSEHNSRYSLQDVEAVTLPATAKPSQIAVKDGALMVSGADVPSGTTLALVSYIPGVQEVSVKRGENGGRKLTLTNVVTDIVEMPWTGEAVTTTIAPETGLAYAALFHAAGGGTIISASTFSLNTPAP